jgi:hypothetical protein
VAGGWWLVAGGWWLVAGGWWLVAAIVSVFGTVQPFVFMVAVAVSA